MRVATSTLNAVLLAQSLKVQAEYGQALTQQASGGKSASLSGLGGAAGQTVSLTSDLELSARLVSRAETAQAMIETGYQSLAGIGDLITTALTSVSSALNGTDAALQSVATAAAGWLADTATALNTDYAGSYVFGGAGADTAPVDLDAAGYDPTADADAADTGYYQGNGAAWSLMIDGDTRLDYGVRADAEPLEATLRAFALLAAMDTDTADTDLLTQAFTLLDDAAAELGVMMEELSAQTDSLAALADRVTDFLCVELNNGQMLHDIRLATQFRKPVHFYNRMGGNIPTTAEVTAAALSYFQEG